ncbi:RimK family protein [Aromatoleum petrolei]|uniref:ATP-grasp domain-containing protein n=1 Tax=Aromatoleum petrolei TaxID=76116 RepID=A0ABX1MNK6_9RHOO|nr:RimK family protein [Aromatoleum petrolei]NMF87719.1 ATP-grasp domain-containing protein [Aromatoleum petrolei]QTQ38207.1 Putative RimK-like protein [Aromatoleum petrolei]
MSMLVVVSNPKDWSLALPDVNVVSAREYLTDPACAGHGVTQVFNLCRSYRYQSLGYYVSLLAEARSQKPLPGVTTIEDLQSQNLVRLLTSDLHGLIQSALAPIRSDSFTLSIYFGRNLAERYDLLSRHLFNLLQAPLLQADFVRKHDSWQVKSVVAVTVTEVPPQHRDFMIESARAYFSGRWPRPRRRYLPRFTLAILRDPDNTQPASNAAAIRKFEKAARALGLATQVIGRQDLARLPQFDALFIRDNTFINHYTYRFSRRAAAEGLVVIDDPVSILRCNNKVYLAELLPQHNIATPKTLLVHRGNVQDIIPALGLPCVLKQPDSCLSIGVVKAETAEELQAHVTRLLENSELIVAQEFLPTEFDWRVGILDRRLLFVCKYHMARGHWQIIHRDAEHNTYEEGPTTALALEEAPSEVLRTALRAANLIGDGFYGVDLKQVGDRCCVIEVNDNPNVDAGNEDNVLKDALYHHVMDVFATRLEHHAGRLA